MQHLPVKILNCFVFLVLLVLINCKPEEKDYHKESNSDDFVSADLSFNGNYYNMNLNRDTNHMFVNFDNGPPGKAYVTIDASKDNNFYFYIKLHLDSLKQIKEKKNFPINNSNDVGTAYCEHKNGNFSKNEVVGLSGTLYIDEVDLFYKIRGRFNCQMKNGLGDDVQVTNGRIEFD